MIQIISQIREEIKTIPTEEYALGSKPSDIKADLSLNINPFGVSPKVMDRLKKLSTKTISHYYSENKELIRLIANYVKVKPQNILMGDGCDGCLEMIAKTFITKKDNVIIPIPTFHRYEFHTKLMGGVPEFINMPNFNLPTEEIITLLPKKSAKLIFLCNPNNPTGKEIRKEDKIKILENFNGIVVVDEALADITTVNGSELIKKYKNLIIVRSFSKSFGLASLRIGYIISHPEIISQIRKVSSPFKVNGVAQELAIESLRDKEHIKKSVEFLNQQREYLIKELNNIGLECTDSKTTNILVNIEKINKDAKNVVSKLEERGVLVTDASYFRVPQNKYIRIAVSSNEENRVFVQTIKDLLNNET